MKRVKGVRCSCGKLCDNLLEWSTHYRAIQPKIKSHKELSASELAQHVNRAMTIHNKNHRPEKP